MPKICYKTQKDFWNFGRHKYQQLWHSSLFLREFSSYDCNFYKAFLENQVNSHTWLSLKSTFGVDIIIWHHKMLFPEWISANFLVDLISAIFENNYDLGIEFLEESSFFRIFKLHFVLFIFNDKLLFLSSTMTQSSHWNCCKNMNTVKVNTTSLYIFKSYLCYSTEQWIMGIMSNSKALQ